MFTWLRREGTQFYTPQTWQISHSLLATKTHPHPNTCFCKTMEGNGDCYFKWQRQLVVHQNLYSLATTSIFIGNKISRPGLYLPVSFAFRCNLMTSQVSSNGMQAEAMCVTSRPKLFRKLFSHFYTLFPLSHVEITLMTKL